MHVKPPVEPLIVLHGGPGLTHSYLLPHLLKLSSHYRLIFYDQKGVDNDSLTIDVLIEELEGIRKSQKLEQVSLFGHSFGALLAIQYALRFKDRVKQIILVSPVPISHEDNQKFNQEVQKRLSPTQDTLKAIEKSPEFTAYDPSCLKRYFDIFLSTYLFDPKAIGQLNIDFTPPNGYRLFKSMEIFNQILFDTPYDWRPQLKLIKHPTLIIHGDSDPIALSSVQRLHKGISNSTLSVIGNCGHFPFIEQPEFFMNLITNHNVKVS